MTKLTIAVIAVLVVTVAFAGEFDTGFYSADDYFAPYVFATEGNFSIYHEHDIAGSSYDLTVAKYNLGHGMKAVVRKDDTFFTRPGLQFGIGGGGTNTQIVVLAGLDNAPTWVDVCPPAMPIIKHLDVTSHLRFKEGGNNDYWVGVTYSHGRFDAYYHLNLRSSGSPEFGGDYQLTSW